MVAIGMADWIQALPYIDASKNGVIALSLIKT